MALEGLQCPHTGDSSVHFSCYFFTVHLGEEKPFKRKLGVRLICSILPTSQKIWEKYEMFFELAGDYKFNVSVNLSESISLWLASFILTCQNILNMLNLNL